MCKLQTGLSKLSQMGLQALHNPSHGRFRVLNHYISKLVMGCITCWWSQIGIAFDVLLTSTGKILPNRCQILVRLRI